MKTINEVLSQAPFYEGATIIRDDGQSYLVESEGKMCAVSGATGSLVISDVNLDVTSCMVHEVSRLYQDELHEPVTVGISGKVLTSFGSLQGYPGVEINSSEVAYAGAVSGINSLITAPLGMSQLDVAECIQNGQFGDNQEVNLYHARPVGLGAWQHWYTI